MRRSSSFLLGCLLAAACAAPAPGPSAGGGEPTAEAAPPARRAHSPAPRRAALAAPVAPHDADEDDGPGVAHAIRLWLPNRIFDLLDLVRARVKLGPGLGFTPRATELFDVKLGTWTCVWIGLHGPRREPVIPWIGGTETYSAAGISLLEAEWEEQPYGLAEIGVGVHAMLAGVDAGVDLFEVFDFVTGLLFIDLMGDDL